MIEAYEIGIRLALQDGVSEGVAAIRRDLGSLDLAIAQTTLRLSQLQRIGAQALAASQEQPERLASGLPARKPPPVVMPPLPPEPEPIVTPAKMQAVMPTPTPLPRPLAKPSAVLTATRAPAEETGPVSPAVAVRPDVAAPKGTTHLPAIVADTVRAPDSPRPPEQPVAAPLANAVQPVSSPVAAVVTRLVAPMLQPSDSRSQKDEQARELAPPPTVVRMPSAPGNATVAPQQAPIEPERRERIRQSMHRHVEMREVHAQQATAASDQPTARMMPAPVRPADVFSPTPSVAPSASPSYAPPAASPRSKETAMRGDVFFDGTRVGRWMSEQMARDAGRPNTGPTGFDPRRSPAWPGAAVTW